MNKPLDLFAFAAIGLLCLGGLVQALQIAELRARVSALETGRQLAEIRREGRIDRLEAVLQKQGQILDAATNP